MNPMQRVTGGICFEAVHDRKLRGSPSLALIALTCACAAPPTHTRVAPADAVPSDLRAPAASAIPGGGAALCAEVFQRCI